MRPEINVRVDLCYDSPSSGNAVSKYGDYTMTYDEIGNPISYKGYSMAWTKAKQLASVSGNGIAMSFKYDSNGIRTLKRVNGVDTEFTYAGTTLVSQKTGNEIINFAYTAGGAPYGFTYNGTNYFYLLNLQGDIIGIYDSNGDVVVKYAYDSWGQLMSITGTLADTIGVKNPLRYRGYYYDTETKLYYLQSRYYDPETCHFISMDSYFVAGDYINGMNMYAYCANNPVNMVDCSGYCHGYANNPDLSSPYSGVRYGYNCGSYGLHVRNPRDVKSDVSAGTVVGISSDAMGTVGTGLEVAAANSSKLTNVGGGVWEMQTTMPKAASTGKGIGIRQGTVLCLDGQQS